MGDIADDCLATLMNVNMLHSDLLLATCGRTPCIGAGYATIM